VQVVDWLADFRGQDISTAVYQGVRTGTAIGYVLDAIGWTAGRDLDPGATVIPLWWEDGTDALTALDKIVRSEGFPALLTIGSSGEVIFRDRHHRLTRSASTTVQSTWRGSGAVPPIMTTGGIYDDAWQNIVNTASVSVDQRRTQSLQTVWSLDVNASISSTPQTFWATMDDPVVGAVVPSLANDDLTLDPTWVGFGVLSATLTRTSGQSIGITLSTSGGGVRISAIRLRAKPMSVVSTGTISSSDATSVTTYGQSSFSGDLPWCNTYDAQAILDLVVAARKDPLPVMQARFVIGNDTAAAGLLLPRNLSDRVRIVEPETNLNDDFHIEQISHLFTGDTDHEMTFSVEHVPPSTGTPFLVGSSLIDGSNVIAA
jgi:hypothetical protein